MTLVILNGEHSTNVYLHVLPPFFYYICFSLLRQFKIERVNKYRDDLTTVTHTMCANIKYFFQ